MIGLGEHLGEDEPQFPGEAAWNHRCVADLADQVLDEVFQVVERVGAGGRHGVTCVYRD